MASESLMGGNLRMLVSANLITIAILFLVYFCYLHLQEYIYCLLYGFLLSEALWPIKLRMKSALERIGLPIGDFFISFILLGVLGFFALFVTLFVTLFAFIDVLDFVQQIRLGATQSKAALPQEWLNGMHFWLESQVEILQTYNETAWYPLVNDTVTYIGKMSAEGKSLSHHTFLEQLRDADVRQHLMDRINVILYDMGTMDDMKDYAQTTLFTSASFVSQVGFQVFSLLSGALDGLSRVLFLLSIAQYLLSRDVNVMRTFIRDFTRNNVQTGMMETEMQAILDSAFVYPLGVAVIHGTITLGLGVAFGIPYPFLATFILVLFSLVPMLGTVPSLALIPFALATGIIQGLVFIAIHILVLHMMQGWEMQQIWGKMDTDPYLTALLVCLGYSSMGWQAIILGPLCIGPLTFAYRLFTDDNLRGKVREWPSSRRIIASGKSQSCEST